MREAEDEHGKKPDNFKINEVAGMIDENGLRRARAVFEIYRYPGFQKESNSGRDHF